MREFKALARHRNGRLGAEVARDLLGRCAPVPSATVPVAKRCGFVEVREFPRVAREVGLRAYEADG